MGGKRNRPVPAARVGAQTQYELDGRVLVSECAFQKKIFGLAGARQGRNKNLGGCPSGAVANPALHANDAQSIIYI